MEIFVGCQTNSVSWVLVRLLQRSAHSITLFLGQAALTVLLEKQIMAPLSMNHMGWRVAVGCCGSHAVRVLP